MRVQGTYWEQVAQSYIEKHGLTLLERNFTVKAGEIDLVMKEANTYVFVEVKYRQSNHYGGAIEAVGYKKQEKIRRSAAIFLQQKGLNAYNTACRFDVIAINGSANPEITWLKNAF